MLFFFLSCTDCCQIIYHLTPKTKSKMLTVYISHGKSVSCSEFYPQDLLLTLAQVLLLTFCLIWEAERLLNVAWLTIECFLFFFSLLKVLPWFSITKKSLILLSVLAMNQISFSPPCIYSDYAGRWKTTLRWVIRGRGQENSHFELPRHPVMLTVWASVFTGLRNWSLSREKWLRWAPHFFNNEEKFLVRVQT